MKLNTKTVFLMDGVGAFLSAVVTGAVLPLLYNYTGVSREVALPLSFIALSFSVYSFTCFWFVTRRSPLLLLVLVFGNLLYCLLLGSLLLSDENISSWGRSYFAAEIIVLAVIILIEYRIYRNFFDRGPSKLALSVDSFPSPGPQFKIRTQLPTGSASEIAVSPKSTALEV